MATFALETKTSNKMRTIIAIKPTIYSRIKVLTIMQSGKVITGINLYFDSLAEANAYAESKGGLLTEYLILKR